MMAMHQPMRLSHQSFELHGYVQVGTSKWYRCRQGGERLRTLPPLVGIGATSIWGICPGSCGLLAEASALAGMRMLAHIPPLAGVGVMASIGAGLSWRAVWAVGIQDGCTCQPFLPNSIFVRIWGLMEGRLGRGDLGQLYLPAVPPQLHLCENLGAYGGPSGPRGSRAAVPASRSSPTPSL